MATAAVIAVTASLSTLTGTAGAQEASPVTGVIQPAARAATSAEVTLVTGDVVTLATTADGHQTVDVRAAEGTAKTFETYAEPDGASYVIPSDVAEAVASGVVDKRLFNVTRLVEDGYADARSGELPVILAFEGDLSDAALRDRAEDLPAARTAMVADKVDMAGVRVDKHHAAAFWRAIRPSSHTTATASGMARPGDAAKGAAGVSRLYYDGQVKASLDVSVPQIGAPAAWAEGFDGAGVKVAVLDTGVDETHPDLKGRIIGSRSFIDGQAVTDLHGHGTHVASTIAGSGAASDGRNKGVAPAADLLIGKVLANSGSGNDSQIIAGMEWAAEQGADIISMSLGGPATGGPDPMTAVVERLTASTGTLFVIAAGNSGPGAQTIGTPGTADSALTVGAVDDHDALAGFSSRGPRKFDYGIKPDITAPGVGIVAARATGTTMGTPSNPFYTSANGTSMATPHVAGAAALLAQAHPEWDGTRIKNALTAHATPHPTSTVYEQGGGRVDIPASLHAPLELSGSADFGLVEYSETGYDKRTRSLKLTNPTTSALTVTLTAEATGTLPDGALNLPATTIDVPAGGTVAFDVVLDPTGVPAGRYGGRITATTTNGATAHAVVGFSMEPKRYDLALTFKDRRGNAPKKATFQVFGLDNDYFSSFSVSGGQDRIEVPSGRYSLTGLITTAGGGKAGADLATDLYNIPQVDLQDKDAAVTVDATQATDLDITPLGDPRPLEHSEFALQNTRFSQDGTRRATVGLVGISNSGDERYGAIPSGPTEEGTSWASLYVAKREPLIQASVARPETFRLSAKTSSYLNRFQGTETYDVVDVGAGTPADLAGKTLSGKAALLRLDKLLSISTVLKQLETAGAAAVVVAPNDDAPQDFLATGVRIPYFATTYADGRRLAGQVTRGRTSVTVKGVKESGYAYAGQWDFGDGIPSDLSMTAPANDFAKVKNSFHTDGAERIGYHTTHAWGPYPMVSVRSPQFLYQGSRRDDHLRAYPTLAYAQKVTTRTDSGTDMTERRHTYRPGQTSTETWWAPAMHPSKGTDATCNFCRTDVGTVFRPQLGGDSDPEHYSTTGRIRTWMFFRDGEQITDNTKVMSPQKADYVFVEDNARTRDLPGVTLGSRTRTEYGFTSVAPTGMRIEDCKATVPTAALCEALPVVLLDYRMPTDLTNQTPADKRYAFTVDASRALGYEGPTRMAGAEVSVSFDGGATWRSADVDRVDKNSFRASYRHPEAGEGDGFVSVRTAVRDEAGNRTVQTITRAYALK
ncbi:S8 family peptidase [Streptomyces hydrogenans]|uniref:S8 family peptidase n=1 Tax=Streptomyces hydrogenans TaxID=1873719 RepID=UPI00278C644B|nr:S8 family serine peptidase [Streptomyces hydrogenans]